jgi:hypothetical protein
MTGRWVKLDDEFKDPECPFTHAFVWSLWPAQERVTDLECCHDAGDCAEPLCGRAGPSGRVE